MPIKIDYLIIKLCENLPLNFTFFEEDGFCGKPNEYCRYCDNDNETHFCRKQTYTARREPTKLIVLS